MVRLVKVIASHSLKCPWSVMWEERTHPTELPYDLHSHVMVCKHPCRHVYMPHTIIFVVSLDK